MKGLKELTRKDITGKLRGLKIGDQFVVSSKSQRTIASQQAKLLRDSGLITFSITTFAQPNGTFTVIAV